MQFQPWDAGEQCIEEWCTLKQRRDVQTYFDSIDKLHHIWPLCERAEFGMAMRGLKIELKGIVRRALTDQRKLWLTLRELRNLAKSAEIERATKTRRITLGQRPYQPPQIQKENSRDSPKLVRALEVRDKGGARNNDKQGFKDLPCGVCNVKGHRTRACRYKKGTGCWRCGGDHFISKCEAPFSRSVSPTATLTQT